MSSDQRTLSRATSVPEMRQRMKHFQSEAGAQHSAAFRPEADDVIIVTYPKSGTTWMQQLVHALRTGGDMDFEEITQVVPWIEMAWDMEIPLHGPQRAEPRLFKSHNDGDEAWAGCRYIFVVRDPRDVLLSFHRFFEGWVFEPGSIDLETFAHEFFLGGSLSGDYWSHLLSWWQREPRSSTLMMSYEEMKADLEGTLSLVSGFVGIHDASAQRTALRCASLETMQAHAGKFDDHLLRARRDPVLGLPPGGSSSKVASGKVGGHRGRLSEEILDQIQKRWSETITPALGFAHYAGLLKALPAERARRLNP